MSDNKNLDHLSLSTTPIFLWKDQELVSQGTGFYYAFKEKELTILCLITNYHVLTGWSPTENREPIGNNIAFHFHRNMQAPGDVKVVRVNLHAPNGKPIWITNQSYTDADMAIIPLPTNLYQDCKINCISKQWAESNLLIRPTTSVTLIGYPYGFYDKKNSLPIWKTGNVATEPKIDFDGKPLFLIDVSAFPGMSGSPVFGISHGTYESEGGGTTVGSARKFLGIYASMQMHEEKKYLEQITQDTKFAVNHLESLEIGHVWKANLILDTLQGIDFDNYLESRGMNKPKEKL